MPETATTVISLPDRAGYFWKAVISALIFSYYLLSQILYITFVFNSIFVVNCCSFSFKAP
jgi:hypothetical protein